MFLFSHIYRCWCMQYVNSCELKLLKVLPSRSSVTKLNNSKTKFLGVFCHRRAPPAHLQNTPGTHTVTRLWQAHLRDIRGLGPQFYHRIRRKPLVKMMLQKSAQGILLAIFALLRFSLSQEYAGYSEYNCRLFSTVDYFHLTFHLTFLKILSSSCKICKT